MFCNSQIIVSGGGWVCSLLSSFPFESKPWQLGNIRIQSQSDNIHSVAGISWYGCGCAAEDPTDTPTCWGWENGVNRCMLSLSFHILFISVRTAGDDDRNNSYSYLFYPQTLAIYLYQADQGGTGIKIRYPRMVGRSSHWARNFSLTTSINGL